MRRHAAAAARAVLAALDARRPADLPPGVTGADQNRFDSEAISIDNSGAVLEFLRNAFKARSEAYKTGPSPLESPKAVRIRRLAGRPRRAKSVRREGDELLESTSGSQGASGSLGRNGSKLQT